jgi:recombination protein RecA
MLIRSGALDIIVIDSVAALVPRAEIEGEMGDSTSVLQGPADEPGAAQDHRRAEATPAPPRSSSTTADKIGVMFGSDTEVHRWPAPVKVLLRRSG